MTKIGILVYPQVEVLDFCGPFEVFRNVGTLAHQNMELMIVAKTLEPVDAQGLSINPTHNFTSCPQLDMLLVPGGNGKWLMEQQEYQQFIERQRDGLSTLFTVCTGALIVGKMGLISRGMDATTHLEGMDLLRELAPDAQIHENVRFTDNGKLVMSGGISAGIDAALYLVSVIWDKQLAKKIALYMEYDWRYVQPMSEYKRPDIQS